MIMTITRLDKLTALRRVFRQRGMYLASITSKAAATSRLDLVGFPSGPGKTTARAKATLDLLHKIIAHTSDAPHLIDGADDIEELMNDPGTDDGDVISNGAGKSSDGSK